MALLQDVNHKMIDTYGIYNPAEEQFDDQNNKFKESGIPYPIVYIITKDGKVASRLFDQVTYERATNAQIRSELLRLGIVKQ